LILFGKDSFNTPEIVFGVVAKNGSFGFAKDQLVCWAKPNVPFVRILILY